MPSKRQVYSNLSSRNPEVCLRPVVSEHVTDEPSPRQQTHRVPLDQCRLPSSSRTTPFLTLSWFSTRDNLWFQRI